MMIDRKKVIRGLEHHLLDDDGYPNCNGCPYAPCSVRCHGDLVADALALLKAQEPITGETSDGYHTFNELYHHRAVLFSVIVANYKDRAWKSVRHHDGTMYDGMFIVGIDTPDGQATYHYDIDPYWDMFDCKVREFAPEWDGHTPAQAIERIGKLKAQEPIKPIFSEEIIRYVKHMPAVDAVPVVHGWWSEKRWMTEDDWGVINHRAIVCSACKGEIADGEKTRYCPNCGAKMNSKRRESE